MTKKLQAILEAEGLSSLLEKFNEQGVTDSILCDLTDSDLKELRVDKLGERKRLLAAFGKSGGASAGSVVEESAVQTSGGAPPKTAAAPAEATKDLPWVNTLGMPFVPIPRFDTRFCVRPVRVQDYEAYCMSSGAKFPEIPFPQESDHPIVGVSWNEAIEFCVWLTGKERSEGKIDDRTVYRLPTDLEWTAEVGLPHEREDTPAERHLKAPGYPWGLRWPPPQNAGNYEHQRDDQLGLMSAAKYCRNLAEEVQRDNAEYGSSAHSLRILADSQNATQRLTNEHKAWQRAWQPIDAHEFTSSVGLFPPNSLGIFDLGGNVREWCMDSFDASRQNKKVLRGASFSALPTLEEDWTKPQGDAYHFALEVPSNEKAYQSSYRFKMSAEMAQAITFLRPDVAVAEISHNDLVSVKDYGFRVVAVGA